jgi:hypothetical protein
MGVLGDATTSLHLGEQRVVLGIELVDALHGTDIHARAILHIDTRLGDDRKARHLLRLFGLTVVGVASMLGIDRSAPPPR